MRLTLLWAVRHAHRRWTELVAVATTTGLCIALLTSLGAFLAMTRSDVTAHATANVSVDWQVQLTSAADPATVVDAISHRPHSQVARAISYARVATLAATDANGDHTTGQAYVAALPADYAIAFPGSVRTLLGDLSGPVLLQQTAANLGAAPGSSVRITPAIGRPATAVQITGVIDLPQAATLFQTVGSTTTPSASPDNVIVVPPGSFDRVTAGAPVVRQVHVHLDRSWLPHDPSAAAARTSSLQHQLEAALPGQVTVGDNLEAALLGAREDALYGQLLFLMLGLPAFAVALGLVGAVIGASAPRRAHEHALLAMHGVAARTRRLVLLGELATGALAGVALGAPATLLTTRFALGRSAFSPSWFVVGAACAIAALVIVGRTGGAADVVNRSGPSTYRVPATALPRPIRYGLDLGLLIAGGVVFALLARGRYQVVVAPEGVATTSVDWAALLAPALALPGIALVTVRLTHLALRLSPTRPRRDGRELVLASLRRRRRSVALGAGVLALSVGVAGAAAVFDRTYQRQATVDVGLTVGSDVAVTLPAGDATAALRTARQTPFVTAASAQIHRLAYVGNDLQDIFGIDAATIRSATHLSDAFVPGATVPTVLARLRADAHGVLLSAETLHDYQLHVGDPVRLRLRDAHGTYTAQPFVVRGQVSEWPTAPKDSFIVANESYLSALTSDRGSPTILVTTAHRRHVADSLQRALGPTAIVSDATRARSSVTTASGLAAVDLRGLSRLELGMGLLLAASSLALTLALGVAGRRRTLAVLAMLAATARQRRRFVVTDAYVTVVGGLVGGAVMTVGAGYLYVRVLNGIFDPPPRALAVPWTYLALLGATVVSVVAVLVGAAARLVRTDPAALREDS